MNSYVFLIQWQLSTESFGVSLASLSSLAAVPLLTYSVFPTGLPNAPAVSRREEFELKRKMNRHQEAMKVAIAKKLLSQEEIEEELDLNTEDETVSDASEDALEKDDNEYYYASTDDITEDATEQNTKSNV
ncbi:hypothetical protein AVEN_35802-1 [Araneus ventricosus]|uniref:Uncharacterized protein n=1 Tax=Araneus ventricosus TaxID=182803 RepID=A0A4Y2BM29_ARAVE|nr:hypothetical protein AVEN_35802-1 [Araneus ventricosus]